MRRHRRHSIEFKRQVAQAHLDGESLHALAQQHDVDRSLIRLWVRKYEAGAFDAEAEAAATLHAYEAKIAQLERKVGQLTMELDFLKGALQHARSQSDAPTSPVAGPPVSPSSGRGRLMNVARSSFYAVPAAQAPAEAAAVERIQDICAEFPAYGYRRVTAQLRHDGLVVNHKRVMRLMKALDLTVRPRRRHVATTDSDHDGPIFPNLAKGLCPIAPDVLWVADLSYIAIARGFVYLAVILDAWSRKVVGYAIGRRIDVRLTLAALDAASDSRRPSPGCIHHSDRGSQYAAAAYRERLAEHRLQGSMGRRANPYDNAKAESFLKTLKVEAVYMTEYETYADVVADLPQFIDHVYNTRRLHSALGYLSPTDYEEIHTRPG